MCENKSLLGQFKIFPWYILFENQVQIKGIQMRNWYTKPKQIFFNPIYHLAMCMFPPGAEGAVGRRKGQGTEGLQGQSCLEALSTYWGSLTWALFRELSFCSATNHEPRHLAESFSYVSGLSSPSLVQSDRTGGPYCCAAQSTLCIDAWDMWCG